MTMWSRAKFKVYGLVLILITGSLVYVAVGMYNQSFTEFMPVTLRADRAGLQMNPGNRVKIQGVDLGKVDSVKLAEDGDSVEIELALFPELARTVPANVTARLEQLTAFGNKTVQLDMPADPSSETLAAGSVITADHVSSEVNTVFDNLTSTLAHIEPVKLNMLLGNMAEALRGRGDAIGEAAVRANDYLKRFNPNLPALQEDFRAIGGFADLYADVTPDLAHLLDNATVTAGTLEQRQPDLHSTLVALSDLGVAGTDFFALNAEPLSRALSALRPTTSLLAEYSPMIACTLNGYILAEHTARTEVYTERGALFEGSLSFGDKKYSYPEDLPEVGPGDIPGPNCRGLPILEPGEEVLADATPDPKSIRATTQTPRLPETPLVVQLFGSRELGPQPDQPVEDK